MNKKEYLQKKGILVPDVMYIINSTRVGVTLKELPILEVKSYDNSKTYIFKESPYELKIKDGEKYSEDHGYGTGFGDVWSWSNFGTFDKDLAQELYDKEKSRILKYQLNF